MHEDKQIMLAAEQVCKLDAHVAGAISTFSSLLISKSVMVNWVYRRNLSHLLSMRRVGHADAIFLNQCSDSACASVAAGSSMLSAAMHSLSSFIVDAQGFLIRSVCTSVCCQSVEH